MLGEYPLVVSLDVELHHTRDTPFLEDGRVLVRREGKVAVAGMPGLCWPGERNELVWNHDVQVA